MIHLLMMLISNVCHLSDELIKIYGDDYISKPRLEQIARKNLIDMKGFERGEIEPYLFKDKKYSKIDKSMERKVKMIYDIFIKVYKKELRTNPTSKKNKLPALICLTLWFLVGFITKSLF